MFSVPVHMVVHLGRWNPLAQVTYQIIQKHRHINTGKIKSVGLPYPPDYYSAVIREVSGCVREAVPRKAKFCCGSMGGLRK